MPHAQLDNLNIYYEEFGRGDALLFLHSHFSRSLLAFSAQILHFPRITAVFSRIFAGTAARQAPALTGTAGQSRMTWRTSLIFLA